MAKRKRIASTNDAGTENQPEEQPKRYRLRSGTVGTITKADENDQNNGQTVAKLPAKPKSGPKPFINYTGTVEYYTEADDIEAACAKLL